MATPVSTAAEDVLMEVLMERDITDASDATMLGSGGAIAAPQKNGNEATFEGSAAKREVDKQMVLESYDLTDDDLYEILLEIDEELQTDSERIVL